MKKIILIVIVGIGLGIGGYYLIRTNGKERVAKLLSNGKDGENIGANTEGGAVPEEKSPLEYEEGDYVIPEKYLEIRGAKLWMPYVKSPKQGFLLIRAEEGGKPGSIIGKSNFVPAALFGPVEIPLTKTGEKVVYAELRLDGNKNGMFDDEATDPVVKDEKTGNAWVQKITLP